MSEQGFGCFIFCPSRKAWSCICHSTDRERVEFVAEVLREAVEALPVRVVELTILEAGDVRYAALKAPRATDLFPDFSIE